MKPPLTWQHDTHTSDGHTTVVLSGEIDMAGAADLQNLLENAVRAADAVIADLAEVTFIDSCVISALVTTQNTATVTGCRFTVARPGAQVRKVLQITGVLDILTADVS